jgi:hypothetical protein
MSRGVYLESDPEHPPGMRIWPEARIGGYLKERRYEFPWNGKSHDEQTPFGKRTSC